MNLPSDLLAPRFQSQTVGHAIKPITQPSGRTQAGCATDQDQKGRLEGILGIVHIVEYTTADREDHGPMSPHQ